MIDDKRKEHHWFFAGFAFGVFEREPRLSAGIAVADIDLLFGPVDIMPLEPGDLTAPHPGSDGDENSRLHRCAGYIRQTGIDGLRRPRLALLRIALLGALYEVQGVAAGVDQTGHDRAVKDPAEDGIDILLGAASQSATGHYGEYIGKVDGLEIAPQNILDDRADVVFNINPVGIAGGNGKGLFVFRPPDVYILPYSHLAGVDVLIVVKLVQHLGKGSLGLIFGVAVYPFILFDIFFLFFIPHFSEIDDNGPAVTVGAYVTTHEVSLLYSNVIDRAFY